MCVYSFTQRSGSGVVILCTDEFTRTMREKRRTMGNRPELDWRNGDAEENVD